MYLYAKYHIAFIDSSGYRVHADVYDKKIYFYDCCIVNQYLSNLQEFLQIKSSQLVWYVLIAMLLYDHTKHIIQSRRLSKSVFMLQEFNSNNYHPSASDIQDISKFLYDTVNVQHFFCAVFCGWLMIFILLIMWWIFYQFRKRKFDFCLQVYLSLQLQRTCNASCNISH